MFLFFKILPLVVAAAIIDSVNLCAFSVLLLTVAFLFSAGKLRSGIIKIGGFYIAGIFLVYVLIGLGIMQTLHFFNMPHFMAKIGASLLILFGGINIINELNAILSGSSFNFELIKLLNNNKIRIFVIIDTISNIEDTVCRIREYFIKKEINFSLNVNPIDSLLIQLKDISFSYPDGTKIFDNFSLKILKSEIRISFANILS